MGHFNKLRAHLLFGGALEVEEDISHSTIISKTRRDWFKWDTILCMHGILFTFKIPTMIYGYK